MPREIQNFRDLFIVKLNSLFEVEDSLIDALPKMMEAASDHDLKETFKEHLEKTEVHAERLKRCLALLEQKPQKISVDAINGLISDAEWVIDNIEEPSLLDAGLISAAQYIEHYEIAGYSTAIEWANTLGYDDIEEILRDTLDEENDASKTLDDLATLKINFDANDVGSEESIEDAKDRDYEMEDDEYK